jgi:hypothetical protein
MKPVPVNPQTPVLQRGLFVAGAVIIVAALGLVVARASLGGTHGARSVAKNHAALASSAPSRKQIEAGTLNYPLSTGMNPSSIKSEYLADKDRTRMTLVLDNVSAAAAPPYRVTNVQLHFVSQYHGVSRAPDVGEAVIDGSISLHSDTPGALAVSRPIGSFLVEGGEEIAVRPASLHRSAYSSERQSGGAIERVSFKIDTREFLKIAAASVVSARFGSIDVRLTPHQLADLREFSARLKPTR